MPESLTVETFIPLIGQDFMIAEPGIAAILTLIETESVHGKSKAEGHPPGALVFAAAPGTEPLAEGAHTLCHAGLGEVVLPLVLLDAEAEGGFLYRAVLT